MCVVFKLAATSMLECSVLVEVETHCKYIEKLPEIDENKG